jgi:hypothetical protein
MNYINKNILKNIFALILVSFVLLFVILSASILFLPFEVHANIHFSDVSTSGYTLEEPVIFGKALQTWVSLIAAIIIFILAFKYMKGGKLGKPVLVIGAGALADALLGLFLPIEAYAQLRWASGLIFSVSVIFAVFWMEKIFTSMHDGV